ncbi:MAG: hypothetical protein JWO67_4559 [Streptosporangiaceae bacterium]|nr:hypothetical protein [Streptosporangiaceae bacterium]
MTVQTNGAHAAAVREYLAALLDVMREAITREMSR